MTATASAREPALDCTDLLWSIAAFARGTEDRFAAPHCADPKRRAEIFLGTALPALWLTLFWLGARAYRHRPVVWAKLILQVWSSTVASVCECASAQQPAIAFLSWQEESALWSRVRSLDCCSTHRTSHALRWLLQRWLAWWAKNDSSDRTLRAVQSFVAHR